MLPLVKAVVDERMREERERERERGEKKNASRTV
jgi:hypothetical protein